MNLNELIKESPDRNAPSTLYTGMRRSPCYIRVDENVMLLPCGSKGGVKYTFPENAGLVSCLPAFCLPWRRINCAKKFTNIEALQQIGNTLFISACYAVQRGHCNDSRRGDADGALERNSRLVLR